MISFDLHTIQSAFKNYIVNTNEEKNSNIQSYIAETGGLHNEKRLKIYFEAYRLRLLEILQDDYPKCYTLLGEEAFDALGRSYIDKYPSSHFSVRYFGQHFKKFLKEFPPYSEHPFLSEMAEFEWALRSTLDAKNEDTLNPSFLNTLEPGDLPTLKLGFHPSFQLLTLEWDTPQIWQAIEEEAPPREPQKLDNPIQWIAWRQGIECLYRSLTEEEATALKIMKSEGNFSDLCDVLSELMPEEEVPSYALTCLHQWLNDGFITNYNV